MAFKKPTINKIEPDIKNLSIYLRSTKKFGKTTLFRDTILEKYGDPSRGLLIKCGNEIGDTLLDEVNSTQITNYKDLIELKEWLITEKGKEHNIEIIAFDTADELALITEAQTIRLSNQENPKKKIKTIKAAFGGYMAGEKYSANDLIKPLITELRNNKFGVWMIAHTKFKTVKEKGSLDENGYQQLSSNLGADYESAFGDIFDATLTGVIDREFEEKQEKDKIKKYTTETVRKLYIRETLLIDAGGRFSGKAVPEYIIFDKEDMAKDFINIMEEGMEKSKVKYTKSSISEDRPKKTEKIPVETIIIPEEKEELFETIGEENLPDEFGAIDTIFEESGKNYPNDLLKQISGLFKECEDKDIKTEIKKIVSSHGRTFKDVKNRDDLEKMYDLLA